MNDTHLPQKLVWVRTIHQRVLHFRRQQLPILDLKPKLVGGTSTKGKLTVERIGTLTRTHLTYTTKCQVDRESLDSSISFRGKS